MKTTGFILRGLCILIFVVSNCYALELKVDALMTENSMVPKSYATVIKGKKGEVVAIGNSNTTYGPSDLNHILAAYKMPEMVVIEVAVVEPVVAVVEVDCVDSDGDTVCDEIDVCGASPKGVKVDERGCWTLEQ